MSARRENFERAIEDYDPKSLTKAVKLDVHRFVSVERDQSMNHYVKGHRTLRAACDFMAREVEEGHPLVPEFVLDLDSGERHEVDLFAFVAPKGMEAVATLLPRRLVQAIAGALADSPDTELAQAHKLLQTTLKTN